MVPIKILPFHVLHTMNPDEEPEPFPTFFNLWIKQLQDHLQRLVHTSKHHNNNQTESISADLAAHHRAYYTAKWAYTRKDVLIFFSPPWLSPLETAHLWITGWKPSMAFKLVESLVATRKPLTSLAELAEEQRKMVERLKRKMKMEEDKVERDMERMQVSVANRKMLDLARQTRRDGGHVAGGEVEVNGLVAGLVAGLEKVVKEADMVRLKTLKGLLEVLSPKQGLDFLAVLSMVLLQQRRWGNERAAH